MEKDFIFILPPSAGDSHFYKWERNAVLSFFSWSNIIYFMIEKVKQILSVKVKLILDEKGKRELVKLCKAYKDAMNFFFVSSF